MLKDKAISEDDEKNGLAEIQKLTDDYIHKLEEVAKKKEQEILTV
jgi:ribosome recycling factor